MTRETRIVAVVVFFCVWSGTSAKYSADEVSQCDQCWLACNATTQPQSQSPININTQDVITKSFPPLTGTLYSDRGPLNYFITNRKYTVRFQPLTTFDRYLEGGPLKGRYLVDYLEFKWGEMLNFSQGGEHTIDGKRYPLEVQWTMHSEKYSNAEEGAKHPGGVLMIAMLLPQVADEEHVNEAIFTIPSLDELTYPHTQPKYFMREMTYSGFFTGIKLDDYYFYNGSFTRPPYSENVIWLVYVESTGINQETMQIFFTLYTNRTDVIQNNFRELQPLNGRQVMQSDKSSRVTGETRKGSQVAERPASRHRGAGASPRLGAAQRPGLSERHH